MLALAIRWCVVISLGVFGMVALSAAPLAWGATTGVDCGSANLQAAIDGAASGDTLVVSGTCAGTFSLSQPITLTLQGAGAGAVLDGGGSGTVLTVSAGSLTVDNITIKDGRGANGSNGPNGGIFASGGIGGDGAPGGVLVASGATLTLTNSQVTLNRGGDGGNGGNGGFAACLGATDGGDGAFGGVGGIENDGTLIVDHTTVAGNAGGSGGSGGNGDGAGLGGVGGIGGAGGIVDNNTLTMTASNVSVDSGGTGGAAGAGGGCGGLPGDDNSGGVGGVEANSTETINSSTIAANVGGAGGGTSGTEGDGGISVVFGGSLNVTNSTISQNQGGTAGGIDDAGLGALVGVSTVTLRYTTISGNTGGTTGGLFDLASVATLTATIVAGNHGPDAASADCAEDPSSNGNPQSGGFNEIGVGDGCFFPLSNSTDDVGTAQSPVVVGLNPLADNGGPTQTMSLPWNSAAVDAIPVGATDSSGALLCPATGSADQRGVIRPQGPACDIGAYEKDDPITATGTALASTEGQPVASAVATFSGPDPNALASDYAASINWGDGSPPSAGTVTAGGTTGSFMVAGSHTYAEEGSGTVTVTITSTLTSATVATATAATTIADAPLTAAGVTAATGQSFTGTVATFTDANTNAPASDFTASIAWGDGSTTAGTVTGSGGSYAVSGQHTYAGTGSSTVTVVISDAGGSTATAATTLLAYAVTAGGNFVIGDVNATDGRSVTFWGSNWAKVNSLSGGPALKAFKGFATTPASPPACGTSWSVNIAVTITPPPAPLPAYIAVIVSSKITKTGSVISGNTLHIVIIKTSPGYQPDPAFPGTGTIVNHLC